MGFGREFVDSPTEQDDSRYLVRMRFFKLRFKVEK